MSTLGVSFSIRSQGTVNLNAEMVFISNLGLCSISIRKFIDIGSMLCNSGGIS